jgi:uncharacterized protein (TIGR02246 family)
MQRVMVVLVILISACGAPPAEEVAAGRSTVTNDATARAELEKIQKDWETALMTHDGAFFARLYADDVTMTGPDGMPQVDRSVALRDTSDTSLGVRNLRVDDRKIRLYAENKVGVVTGVARGLFKEEKKEVPRAIAYTETFVNRDGRWQLVAAHYSMLPK